ncbi:hypothetical protein [Bacillus sp. 1P06AnD]|uniref:hypothetical protein n=1 Tax=Bacillus sp. 1P06AnD TaxID=3132208 RepID=UPI0039A089C9
MDKKAAVTLVLGIMSILLPYFGVVPGIYGALNARRGLREWEYAEKRENRGVLIAAWICSGCGVGLQAILWALFVNGM